MPCRRSEWTAILMTLTLSASLDYKPRLHMSGTPKPRSRFDRRRHRNMIRRPLGAAIVPGNVDIRNAVGQHRRRPDMIEPAAFVGRRPIRRTIAPPRIK